MKYKNCLKIRVFSQIQFFSGSSGERHSSCVSGDIPTKRSGSSYSGRSHGLMIGVLILQRFSLSDEWLSSCPCLETTDTNVFRTEGEEPNNSTKCIEVHRPWASPNTRVLILGVTYNPCTRCMGTRKTSVDFRLEVVRRNRY